NAGTTVWTGTGTVRARDSAQFNNVGVFAANADAQFVGEGDPLPVFANTGTVRKGGNGAVRFDVRVAFNSCAGATVEVLSGSLMVSTGSADGTFIVGPGATLVYRDRVYDLRSQSRVVGAGNVAFTGATVTIIGVYDPEGETQINGGTVTFDGPDPHIRSGSFLSGTITGSSDLTILPNVAFNWNSGTMTGAGKTIVAPGATF